MRTVWLFVSALIFVSPLKAQETAAEFQKGCIFAFTRIHYFNKSKEKLYLPLDYPCKFWRTSDTNEVPGRIAGKYVVFLITDGESTVNLLFDSIRFSFNYKRGPAKNEWKLSRRDYEKGFGDMKIIDAPFEKELSKIRTNRDQFGQLPSEFIFVDDVFKYFDKQCGDRCAPSE